jgi:hypothetical protein
MSKTRCDAVLLNLPEERQDQIIEWIETPKSETCSGGYKFAREQLAADGLKVSERLLSQFYSAHRRKEFFKGAYEAAEDQKDLMLKFDPTNVDRAEAFGDFAFLQQSLKAQDPKTFVMLGNLRESRKTREQIGNFTREKLEQARVKLAQKDRDFALDREKFLVTCCEKLLQAAMDGKAREIATADISNAEKIAKLRQTYFADIDALQASGKVAIPE